jgi:hypothetical protein
MKLKHELKVINFPCKLCFHRWMLRKGGCLPQPEVAKRVNAWLQNSSETNYKVWSKSSKTDFFTRLWIYFGTLLFAGWCPRTPSLPGTMVGSSAPLSPLWASVKESRVPVPCYCSCRPGCWKSKSSVCASSFVWNWEEMVQETFQILRTALGKQCLSRAQIFEWHKRFKGWDSVDNNPRSGRRTTSKTDECVAWELIRANQRLTIRELTVEVGVSYGTCQAILKQDLNMWRVVAKFVP